MKKKGCDLPIESRCLPIYDYEEEKLVEGRYLPVPDHERGSLSKARPTL